MRKTILLKSRYGEIHRLKRIGGSDSCLFLFVPHDNYYWMGRHWIDKEGSYDFVDPSGGPFIQVGKLLPEAKRIVKSITDSVDKKYLRIEFEK